MKKSTMSLIALFTMALSFSQVGPIDFETVGNEWTWATFQPPADESVIFSVADNPSVDALNGSANVGKVDISFATDEGWGEAGCESQHGSDIGAFTITSANSFVTMQIYQEGFASTVALKFATASGFALPEVTASNEVVGEWTEVVFDISAWIGVPQNPVDQIIFFPSYGPRATGHVVYFDNVTFGAAPDATCDDGIQNGDETGVDCGGSFCPDCPPPAMPMVAAPLPNVDPSQVINVFSDFYGPNTAQGENLGAVWAGNGASTLGNYSSAQIVDSNPVDYMHFYQGANTVFIPFGPPIDATTMQFMHIDIWSSNSNTIFFQIQDNSPAEGILNLIGTLVPGQWNSVEIILPTGPDDRDSLGQFNLVNAGGNDYYLDNIYFSAVTTLGVDTVTESSFEIYPNPTDNIWMLKGTQDIVSVQVFDILGKQVIKLAPSGSEVSIDASELKEGIYIAKITSLNGTKTVKLVKN